MADRNTPAQFTFEEWRVEFNELATDVGDIAGVTGASGIIASATDRSRSNHVIEHSSW